MPDPNPSSTRNVRREQFAALAKSLQGELLCHANRMCSGDFDWAKDIVQETLVNGYAAFLDGKFAIGTNARAWLLRILTNQFINQYKRKKKWESELDVSIAESEGGTVPFGIPRDQTSPEQQLMDTVLEEPLELALDALPAQQRMCVLLVDVEQLEYSEAANLLGVPVGTVRSRLARARLQLYTLLLPYAKSRRLV